MGNPERVAIVGGGVAGLACARTLREHGVHATVFDKGRAPGGRLAARAESARGFDLGAQYFTARDPRFESLVQTWERSRACAIWQGRIGATEGPGQAITATTPTTRYVGLPDMAAIERELSRDVDVRSSHRVDAIAKTGTSYTLSGTAIAGTTIAPGAHDGPVSVFGEFDVVLLCLPPAQTEPLISEYAPTLATHARGVVFDPCVALGIDIDVAGTSKATTFPWDGLFVGAAGRESNGLSWIARDSSKPSRVAGERWVLHAGPGLSRELYDAPPPVATDALLRAFAALIGDSEIAPGATTLRRWRFAKAKAAMEVGAVYDDAARMGLAGDWLSGGRIEGAFLSGVALAEHLLR